MRSVIDPSPASAAGEEGSSETLWTPGYLRRLRRRQASLLPLALVVGLIAFYALGLGADRLPWSGILRVVGSHFGFHSLTRPDPTTAAIVWQIRAPRVMLALLVGAALSGSGAVYQALFRNSMADPYIIGVSAGAALGVVLQITVLEPLHAAAASGASPGWAVLAGSRPASGFVAGLLTVLVVYRLATARGRVQTETLLLAGVALSLFLSALVTLLLVRSAGTEAFTGVVFWLMGGLADRSWSEVLAISPWIVSALFISTLYSRRMNVLLLGEETAIQLGISPELVRRVLLLTATVATAAAVSTTGIIGFVGLIIPHLARLVWGPDHRVLLPASILAGAGFLVVADAVARTAFAPQEIPVGIITALAGAPFFLLLLRRSALKR